MNYNSDIPIATDGNQLSRRLLSRKMAVFMDRVCKNHMLSMKRAVFMDKANKRCELSTKRVVFVDGM